MNPIKFKFIDSSKTDYAIPKQLERQLIKLGLTLSNDDDDAVTICCATDFGYKTPSGLNMTPENFPSIQKFLNSKADLLFYVQLVDWFKDRPNAYFLPHGVDTDIFYNKHLERTIDVGFVGKTYKRSNRTKFINILEQHTGFRRNDKAIYFEAVSSFYNKCKIVVNDSQMDELTMRMYEATACGALLLTRKIKNLESIFSDEEIVTYSDNEDMIHKMNYYLKDNALREQIAGKGNKRTISEYSLCNHANFIIQKIKEF